MITNPNGTKRLEGTDLVLVNNFNEVFDSLDNIKINIKDMSINQNNKHIFDITPSQSDNNLSINLYLKILQPSTVSLHLSYSDSSGIKAYNILSSENFSSAGEYTFDPVFIRCNNSTVSLIASSSNLNDAALVSSSVVRM